jgi:hypothetical protein
MGNQEAQIKEMLEALIDSCKLFRWYAEMHLNKHGVNSEQYFRNKQQFDYLKAIIEKATGKSWEEIRG